MTRESIVGPDAGHVISLEPATMRILEDGGTTGHRLGIGEITLAAPEATARAMSQYATEVADDHAAG